MSEERELLARVHDAIVDRQEMPWAATMIEEGIAEIDRRAARRVALLREFRSTVAAYFDGIGRPNDDLASALTGYLGVLLIDLADGLWAPKP